MFDIGVPEVLVLAVIAVVLFGPEKLPQLARKAARVLQYVRQLAGNAQNQLRSELGPGFEDMDFTDLNPKAFVRKHLLEDVEPIVADVKEDFGGIRSLGRETADDLTDQINGAKAISAGGPTDVVNGSVNGANGANGSNGANGAVGEHDLMTKALPQRVLTPYDVEAT